MDLVAQLVKDGDRYGRHEGLGVWQCASMPSLPHLKA